MSGSEQRAILFMLKLEIRLNAEQISEGGKHTPEVLYGMLIRAFQKEQIDYSEKPDETVLYVERWIWYNSDDGEDENDFVVEDVLLHYTNRTSIE